MPFLFMLKTRMINIYVRYSLYILYINYVGQ